MQIEQIDRDAAADLMLDLYGDRFAGDRAARERVLRGEDDASIFVRGYARHRLAALSARPAGDYVLVREIETVTGDFCTEPGEPFYRIEIDGFCADFDYREAADNFAAAINARIAARPAVGEDVVERVARALCSAETGGPIGYFPDGSPMRNDGVWSEFDERQHEDWRNSARVAIAAMGSADMGKGEKGDRS